MVDAEFEREAAEQLAATNKRDYETQSQASLKAADRETYLQARSFRTVGEKKPNEPDPFAETPYV
jgi:hypothetical protein